MGSGTAGQSVSEPTAAVPLRPCLGVLSVAALTLAMVPRREDDDGIGVYMPFTAAAAIVATALAVAACTLPRWVWRPPAGLGRVAVVAAAPLLTHPVAHRAFGYTNETADWVTVVVVVTALSVAVWVAFRRSELPFTTALAAALALALSGVAVFTCRTNLSDNDRATTLVVWSALAGFGLTAS